MSFDTPNPQVGDKVVLSIEVKDVDDLPIDDADGRFIELKWVKPGETAPRTVQTVFKQDVKHFVVQFSSTDLSRAGEYKIWASKLFGYALQNRSLPEVPDGETCRMLPTGGQPCILTVIESEVFSCVHACILADVQGVWCAGIHAHRHGCFDWCGAISLCWSASVSGS